MILPIKVLLTFLILFASCFAVGVGIKAGSPRDEFCPKTTAWLFAGTIGSAIWTVWSL